MLNSPPSPSQQPPIEAVDRQEMKIVPVTSYRTKTPFELPSDWTVQVRPRGPNSPVSADKYYYEPGTGRKFRSLISVKRYLNGEKDPSPTRKPTQCLVPYHGPGSLKRVVYNGKVLRPDELEESRYTNSKDIQPGTLQFRSATTLPDGWIVDEVPRKCGLRSDRYYIDPVTGQRFRSILEVHSFLEGNLCKPKRKSPAVNKSVEAPRTTVHRKKKTSKKIVKNMVSDLMDPPNRINWLYSGDGKDDWSPLVEECMLPNYAAEQWSETFLSGMNGHTHHAPQVTSMDSNQG